MKTPRLIALIPLMVAMMTAVPALGQPVEGPGPKEGVPEPPDLTAGNELTFSIAAGLQSVFKTDLDTAGSYSVNRFGLELGLQYPISGEFQISTRLRYLFDDYKFSGAFTLDPLGGDPWSDINTFAWDFRVRWWMTSDLALVFGPFILSAAESGASFSDSITGGGFAGLLWRASNTLAIGGGLGISSQLEDSVLVYPILLLDWKINENASLSSVAGPVGLAFTGVEFKWAFDGGFEVGTGFRYEYRRFRLDDTGTAPGGVGQDTGLPVWVRVGYRFNPNFAMDLYGGFVGLGKFQLDNAAGDRVGDDDSSVAPTLALALRINF